MEKKEGWKRELDDLLEDYWGYPDGGTEEGFIRGEMGIFELVEQELDKARREYFSMGMEYFSLIDDSNIYQKKGWKLSEEKAERLQILDRMFNLLKDNK